MLSMKKIEKIEKEGIPLPQGARNDLLTLSTWHKKLLKWSLEKL